MIDVTFISSTLDITLDNNLNVVNSYFVSNPLVITEAGQQTVIDVTYNGVNMTINPSWGGIAGNLDDQTDLKNRLLDINGGTF